MFSIYRIYYETIIRPFTEKIQNFNSSKRFLKTGKTKLTIYQYKCSIYWLPLLSDKRKIRHFLIFAKYSEIK